MEQRKATSGAELVEMSVLLLLLWLLLWLLWLYNTTIVYVVERSRCRDGLLMFHAKVSLRETTSNQI